MNIYFGNTYLHWELSNIGLDKTETIWNGNKGEQLQFGIKSQQHEGSKTLQ